MRVRTGIVSFVMALALGVGCQDEPFTELGENPNNATLEALAGEWHSIKAPGPQDLWASVGNMAVARVKHTSTSLLDGRVLVTGGFVSFGVLSNSAEIFDPMTNIFSAAGTLPNLGNGQTSGRWYHAAVIDTAGNVIVTGGELPGNVFLASTVKCTYDSATKSCAWSALADMKYPRRTHALVRLADGRILAAGGNATGDPMVGTQAGARVCELYDPATNTWTETGKLNQGRAYPEAVLLPDNNVLIMGGYDATTINSAEIYDVAAGTWTLLASNMSVPRYIHQAVRLDNGKVLVIGGGTNGSATPTNSVDIFDPATKTFSAAAPMSTARAYHNATLIPGGRVLAAGGTGLASSEVYDPSANTWTNAGNMSRDRGFAAVSRLGNGKVLISGGGTAGNLLNPTNTAEVYSLELPIGSSCAQNSECASGFCADGVCCNSACNAGACDSCATGTCTLLSGNACDDGNACTSNDTCNAGTCMAGAAKTCSALDACHVAGVCDPQNGQCSNPEAPNGTSCDDGDACTSNDACNAGACSAGTAKTCTALDDCHDIGVCDPQNGNCSNPELPDGSSCEGGACKAGICVLGGSGGNGGMAGSGGAGEGGGTAGMGGIGESGGSGGSAGMGGVGESGGSGGSAGKPGDPMDQGGCSCSVPGSSSQTSGVLSLVALGLVAGRKRVRRGGLAGKRN